MTDARPALEKASGTVASGDFYRRSGSQTQMNTRAEYPEFPATVAGTARAKPPLHGQRWIRHTTQLRGTPCSGHGWH